MAPTYPPIGQLTKYIDFNNRANNKPGTPTPNKRRVSCSLTLNDTHLLSPLPTISNYKNTQNRKNSERNNGYPGNKGQMNP